MTELSRDTLKVGGLYNWKGQPEQLVYLGAQWYSGNGVWHQFAKIEDRSKVWCEVRWNDLHMMEETKLPDFNALEERIIRLIKEGGAITSQLGTGRY